VRTLVIDTATAACSVALIDHGAIIAACHEVVNRGHAERLLPMIGELPAGGRADAVLVDCGPGSFTGVRVGLAAALALGFAWGVPVSGYTSTALIAASGFAAHPDLAELAVVMEGGHGELFMQPYAASPLAALAPLASLPPAAALAALDGKPALGGGVRWMKELEASRSLGLALPRAADALLLPQALTLLPPRPIYGRAPDAKPMATPAG
jgi:tRNA threonylcarbamoyladenosine biosynthesis protein TsaB